MLPQPPYGLDPCPADPPFHFIKVGLGVVELTSSLYTFWGATAREYRESVAQHDGGGGQKNSLRQALFSRPWARTTWLCSVFLLGYVGIEVALGGWIVTFMIRVRQGGAFASGMTAMGFWLGVTVGRVVLGFVTPRLGEKTAIAVSLFYPCQVADQ